jgi:hypothetical protein
MAEMGRVLQGNEFSHHASDFNRTLLLLRKVLICQNGLDILGGMDKLGAA